MTETISTAAVPTTDLEEQVKRRIEQVVSNDPQLAALLPEDSVTEAVNEPDLPLVEVIRRLLEGYGDRPALGQRAFEFVTGDDGATVIALKPEYTTVSYRELWERAEAIAAAWHEQGIRDGDFVAQLGFTSTDFASLDVAGLRLGTVSVPLQTGASLQQRNAILEETRPAVFAASIEYLDAAVDSVLATPSVRLLSVFDYHAEVDSQREALEAVRARLESAGRTIVVEALAEALARGRDLPAAPLPSADPDALRLLIYTSGSTGTPKGAMYPQWLVANLWQKKWLTDDVIPSIGVNFMPMSHLAGRLTLMGTLSGGGTAYYIASSDLSTFFEDIALIRPSEVLFVPRVVEMVFQRFQAELDRSLAPGESNSEIAERIKVRIREQDFGGRVLSAGSGSAPLSPEMTEFMESLLQVPLRDGYGSTEAGGVWRDGVLQRPPVTDYKLVDVPELGYFTTDSPHPRGELRLKSETMFPGYYKRPETTADVFDDEGYYKTGDVVAELGPDHLKYLDRVKNVLKLAQGEFVAVSKLEAAYTGSPLVRQIFVYGNSERSFLLAVVVPTPEVLERYADSPDALKPLIQDSLQQVAKDAELQSYEIPRDFIVETVPFTVESGLLSDARKLLRPKLKDHYGERLEALYAELAESQNERLRQLAREAATRPVLETVTDAAAALLGASSSDLAPDVRFIDLGGDSLSALSYSELLRDIFEVDVPVGVINSVANDLAAIARHIEAQRTGAATQPTFASVHGKDATVITAGELTLDKFLDESLLKAAKDVQPATADVKTVLVTGGNGWLGRWLVLDWLERLAPNGGKVYALIRGADAEAARARLDAVYESGDPKLSAHYRQLAQQSLEVIAGDFGDQDLGLSQEVWQKLAKDVDLIVHSGALVNHVLPYSQLFGPNVAGTAEIIKLAISERLKPVTYLSTVGIADQIPVTEFEEDSDVRVMSAERQINDGYANGYGNSKWAGEVLLREAHDLAGLPVRVFRSDMILAHSDYHGQLNVTDVFTRSIQSLLLTGVAPASFYELDADGNRQRAHYDGVPGDFTAASITAIGGVNVVDGYRSFDVFNPHHDGVSMDTFVDWLIDAGYKIARIDDYDQWLARFELALKGLPEQQRQQSVLPLLKMYEKPQPAIDGSGTSDRRIQSRRARGEGRRQR
ncbi:putative fatty-acid-CoA ligase [Mycobacteroides abscessus 6G-0728-R]|uniref:Carboxylic acid reductase n=1 Tax=Mycobacteroides abscessus 1948 TaxID=1299323 RepID=A0A829QKT7_9MYCO|nr:putative fatty-acid-CoA ligase [Mycobacteroides abscessus 6G-0125-R]EIU54405.1 putative fatty-acid-CoA ligase [Mycobacteroides abscessus 6G-0728-S]EIU89966.1 putative fatty-acid-CoA ligase [Mycobacteroides abscessus 6G-0212]EIU96060.1 putative fatty-acid-CoA ligase [Mycobacteroides abscessus 6G-0728-R]EUA63485.1 thioester reductase domain protein [Mycobacteroides abscessus 1948]